MNSLNILKKTVEELEEQAKEIECLGIDLLLNAPKGHNPITERDRWGELPESLKEVQRKAIRKYQIWYNSAYQLIKEHISTKEPEFVKHYEAENSAMGVIDILQLRDGWWINVYSPITKPFLDGFEIQRSILLSVPSVAQIKELSLRKLLTADLARTEMEEAELLFDGKHYRAAGSIAGVALELHLKTQCDIKGVTYKPKDTTDPLATALYTAGILDKTELKHIQYLASIRNSCSHPDPVLEKDVRALIEGVKRII